MRRLLASRVLAEEQPAAEEQPVASGAQRSGRETCRAETFFAEVVKEEMF